jgi:hypothetical protein
MSLHLKRTGRQIKSLIAPRPPPPLKHRLANRYPNWPQIIGRDARKWNLARLKARRGPRVLIATSHGGHTPSATVETLLAVALTLRGANAQFLLCDESLPACQQAQVDLVSSVGEFLDHGPGRLCNWCYPPALEVYRSLGLPLHLYGQFISPAERAQATKLAYETPLAELRDLNLASIAVGEQAYAGALRFYARGELEGDCESEQVYRRYAEAALLTTYATSHLFAARKFVSTCFNHGIYVPQGLIGEVARREGIRVVNWNPAYRKRRFIFTHNETYHHALMTEPTENWESIQWTKGLESKTVDYLKSRWQGTRDWIWYHERPTEELALISAELGIDFDRPTIGLLTNVMWDAQLHYPANAFRNMLEWILATIRYFAARPDLQLVIRIHPAEIRGTVPSRQPVLDEIEKAFPVLPPNIFIISPESNVSTYAVMLQCNSVIIYGTKTGVELTSLGIPTIVAGEAWIRNKGITIDARTADDYRSILDTLPVPARLTDAQRERALKYAYHFFFRRMIPLEMLEAAEGWPFFRLCIDRLDDLMPGTSPGLDLVCDGILRGTEFVFPAERYPDAPE